MDSERTHQNFLELKKVRLTFERVRYTPGLRVDLANFAMDSTSGFKRWHSPFASEEMIKTVLDSFVKEFIPEKADETLFAENGEVVSECQTTDQNVVLGRVWDKKDSSVKTWYLRNKLKKRNIFKDIAKKFSKRG